MELNDIKGIGPATEEDLNEGGVETPEDLVEADLEALSDETGISLERLVEFSEQIEADLDEAEPEEGAEPDEAAGEEDDEVGLEEPAGQVEPEEPEVEATEEDLDQDVKVVLREGEGAATVQVGEDWHEGLPIVTATVEEDADRKLQQVAEDAVLLQEGAADGAVRLDDVTYEEVPLVRRREKEGGVVEETRVEVDRVREKTEPQGLLDRVKGLLG